MARVHLIQHLCPARHCIMAVAYQPDEHTHEQALERLRGMEASLKVNPWCGICGSTELRFEDSETIYTTLAEATPALAQAQLANLEAMRYFADRPKTN